MINPTTERVARPLQVNKAVWQALTSATYGVNPPTLVSYLETLEEAILQSDGWFLTARGWINRTQVASDVAEVATNPPSYMKDVSAIMKLVKRLYEGPQGQTLYMAVLAKLMGLQGPVVTDAFAMAHAGALLRCEAHALCLKMHLAEAFLKDAPAVTPEAQAVTSGA